MRPASAGEGSAAASPSTGGRGVELFDHGDDLGGIGCGRRETADSFAGLSDIGLPFFFWFAGGLFALGHFQMEAGAFE